MHRARTRLSCGPYYYTGGRKKEVLSLKWEDVDFEKSRVRALHQQTQGGIRESDWSAWWRPSSGILMEQRERTGDSEWGLSR